MKKCPQCNNVYTDDTQYCLSDGAVLVEENLPLPSEAAYDEEETIIRHDPIVVDFSPPNEASNYQTAPPNQPTIIIERPRNTGKYLLFLIVGLFLGGGLVLATLLVARNYNQNDNAANLKTNKNQTERVVVSNKNSNSQTTNANLAQNIANTIESNKLHDEQTIADDSEFNGRVITRNAYVRAAPSKSASEVSILPQDDRLKIGERENPNSPWYQVTCEHGVSGWMHGDTIEFTE